MTLDTRVGPPKRKVNEDEYGSINQFTLNYIQKVIMYLKEKCILLLKLLKESSVFI